MKKGVLCIAVLSFLFFAATLYAADKNNERAEKKLRLEEAKKEVNNLEWKIRVTPIGKNKVKPYEDILTFTDSKIVSKELESDGFSASSYTVLLKGEETVIWETMQKNEEGGIVFWRGKIKGDTMRGVVSRHPSKKKSFDFSFQSIERKDILPKEPLKIDEVEGEPEPESIKEEPEL